mgnify:CR=1 FL=1
MSVPTITILLREQKRQVIQLGAELRVIPDWTYFKNFSCPGNIKNQVDIDYCRLGAELHQIIGFFANIKSIEQAQMTFKNELGIEIKYSADAQTIFFNTLWCILLYSRCSVFKRGQWSRNNYIPTSDPNRLFYNFFSVFILEDYISTPDSLPDIDEFKSEMKLISSTLKNLLTRIKNNVSITSDAIANGFIMFDNFVRLFEDDFSEGFDSMAQQIKQS